MTAAALKPNPISNGRGNGTPQVLAWLTTVIAPHGSVIASKSVDWQSATFKGFRLEVTLRWTRVEGCIDGEAFIEFLGEAEMSLPRLMLADAAVLWTNRISPPQELTAAIELLVLESDAA